MGLRLHGKTTTSFGVDLMDDDREHDPLEAFQSWACTDINDLRRRAYNVMLGLVLKNRDLLVEVDDLKLKLREAAIHEALVKQLTPLVEELRDEAVSLVAQILKLEDISR